MRCYDTMFKSLTSNSQFIYVFNTMVLMLILHNYLEVLFGGNNNVQV